MAEDRLHRRPTHALALEIVGQHLKAVGCQLELVVERFEGGPLHDATEAVGDGRSPSDAVPNDHLVNISLGKLLRLDAMLLAGPEQVVEKGHIQLEHLDKLDDAAIGDIKLAIEVKGARVRVRAVDSDLTIINIARQLGRVLVLLVFGLEGADTDAILLAEEQAAHADVLDHLGPIAIVAAHQITEVEAADGAEVADDVDLVFISAPGVELGEEILTMLDGHKVQWLLVHRALLPLALGHLTPVECSGILDAAKEPVVGIDGARIGLRVVFQSLFQAAHNRGLGGTHRAVEQQDALFGAVAFGGTLKEVDQAHQGNFEAEDRIIAIEGFIREEAVADQALLGVNKLFRAVRHDHVVDALKRIAGHLRVAHDKIQVIRKRSAPVELLELLGVLDLAEKLHERGTGDSRHSLYLLLRAAVAPRANLAEDS